MTTVGGMTTGDEMGACDWTVNDCVGPKADSGTRPVHHAHGLWLRTMEHTT